MNPYNFSTLFFAFSFLLIAFLVISSRNTKVTRAYLIYSIAVVCWAVPFSICIGEGISYETALLAMRVSNLFSLFIGSAFYYFALVFSGKKANLTLAVMILLGVLILFFGFTDAFIPSVKSILNFEHYPNAGWLYYIFAALFHWGIYLSFKAFYMGFRGSTGAKKKQYLGLLISAISGYVGGSLSFLPVFNIPMPQWGLFFMPLYPFFMGYFLMKENLFNEDSLVEAAHKDKLATLGTIASSINHEVKTPLYVIEGLVCSHRQNIKEKLYKNKDEESQKTEELLDKITAQTKRAVAIMRDFSHFSKQRIDEIKKESVSLNEVVESVLPLLRYEAETRTIKIENQITDGLAQIYVDRRGLEQVMFNLIVNACQAMRTAGGVIHLKAKEIKNNKMSIVISDNGPGMDLEKQKKVFDSFYTTKEEGTGLGLYITKQLVERNGGTIKVESKEGEGTQFIIELPQALS